MYKILIVDDEAKIREVLVEYAEYEGFIPDQARDGAEAVEKCGKNDYDLVLTDIVMPKLDGLSAIKEIKKISDIPVIILSAKGEEQDILSGFETGADDYVVKPFSPKEVMARINAVLKRYSLKKESASEIPIKFDGLEIDISGRKVLIDGEKAELTPKEYALLFYFAKNKGVALSRKKILSDVWGESFKGNARTVDTHVKMLRGNLKKYKKFVTTARGFGYKFDVSEK